MSDKKDRIGRVAGGPAVPPPPSAPPASVPTGPVLERRKHRLPGRMLPVWLGGALVIALLAVVVWFVVGPGASKKDKRPDLIVQNERGVETTRVDEVPVAAEDPVMVEASLPELAPSLADVEFEEGSAEGIPAPVLSEPVAVEPVVLEPVVLEPVVAAEDASTNDVIAEVSVTITSDPSAADVFLNNHYLGLTPLGVSLEVGSPASLRFRAAGYTEAEHELTVVPGLDGTTVGPIALVPVATLSVSSTPQGAEVVDLTTQSLLGLTPFEVEMPRGDQTIVLGFRRDGFLPLSQLVTPNEPRQDIIVELVPDVPAVLVDPAVTGAPPIQPDTAPAEADVGEGAPLEPVVEAPEADLAEPDLAEPDPVEADPPEVDPDELAFCRFDPDCGGGVGGRCSDDSDCDTDFCCDDNNCGGGMCTFECRRDEDCPSDMRCEHHVCFFACSSDDDCAEGMSCEHHETVCEWERQRGRRR